MSIELQDLWPDDINVEVLPPVAILRAQLEPLRHKTKGILQAELDVVNSDSSNLITYNLDIIAPSLASYRHRILTATHDKILVYPVTITSACLISRRVSESPEMPARVPALPRLGDMFSKSDEYEEFGSRRAAGEREFQHSLRLILKSREVTSIISSLIARSNQLQLDHEKSTSSN